jgi:DNA polymerase-3 subunit gamma/tau
MTVSVSNEAGAPTLAEQKKNAKAARIESVAQTSLVRAVLDRFPGAEIVAVRDVQAPEAAPAMPEKED